MSEVSLIDGHIDNGMTDEDIIKALECCIKNDCDNCPFDSLRNFRDCLKGFLDLINRQKAENEKLNIELKAMRGAANSYKAEVERLREENIIASQKRANIFEILNAYERGRTEAIKEFAERLKSKMIITHKSKEGYCVYEFDDELIDNLVKEMTDIKE